MSEMRLKHIIQIFFIVFLLFSCKEEEKVSCIQIQSWQFHQDTSDNWLPATVPGSVQTDLLVNAKIQNPFFGSNEQRLQWIGESGWVYKSTLMPMKLLITSRWNLFLMASIPMLKFG